MVQGVLWAVTHLVNDNVLSKGIHLAYEDFLTNPMRAER